MNKIEELEQRCEQLESRVEALEKALVASVARPAPRAVVVERMRFARPSEWMERRPTWWPDGEMFKVHPDGVTWYGGQ